MSKGEQTRARVIARAGALMNQTGYLATPLSAILEAVDLQKGGLYNHFSSKEELALAAFGENTRALGQHFNALVRQGGDDREVLFRLIDASHDLAAGRILVGGCPVLNAGTESDDQSELLREAASVSAEALRKFFFRPLRSLEEKNRLKPGLDAKALSHLCLSAVEGGILWTRVTRQAQGQEWATHALKVMLSDRILS